MQERSSTLPMCSVSRTSYIPSTVGTITNDMHSSSSMLAKESESSSELSTSTPELNLLLDKLTEILRFRSGCRRHLSVIQQSESSAQLSHTSNTNLKRLQCSSIEPLHNNADVSSINFNGSLTSTTGAWKSSNNHHKSSISTRSSHHYHQKNHPNFSTHLHHLEKKRRLPCLLQRLIDEGNLIKEAVRRLKTQRFSHTFKQQQQQSNPIDTPSTPTSKSSIQALSTLTSRLTPSSININHSLQSNDSPIQSTSSPSRGISWFLSSSVFGVNASTTNHSSGSGSPLRTCYPLNTLDRTPMEIGIHDG